MQSSDYVVTSYARKHRQTVSDLFFRSHRIHTHLDWYEMDTWLETRSELVRLVWRGETLTAMMAISTPLNGSSWVRLMALHDREADFSALRLAWESLCAELYVRNSHRVALLQARDWSLPMLSGFGFHYQEHIVTLRRLGQIRPVLSPNAGSGITLHPAAFEDVEEMTRIDQLAFSPPWQMTFEDVREARRAASVCMLALDPQGEAVGYALCTHGRDSAHLARLAVVPQAQGHGVGAVLLMDAITRFARKNIHMMTVNTQESNVRSQRLYTRFGFQRNGYDLPVWFAEI